MNLNDLVSIALSLLLTPEPTTEEAKAEYNRVIEAAASLGIFVSNRHIDNMITYSVIKTPEDYS